MTEFWEKRTPNGAAVTLAKCKTGASAPNGNVEIRTLEGANSSGGNKYGDKHTAGKWCAKENEE